MPKTNADYWTAKIRRNVARDETNVGRLTATLYELAGPNIYRYEKLLSTLAAAVGHRPLLLPLPFALWHVVGYLSEFLPNPPITRNQVELMAMDNVAESASAGFEALRIAPHPIENILPQIVQTMTEASGS